MDKKFQVFISSTFDDLQEHRAKVRDTILEMHHFPVGMELFGAASVESWKIITDTIDTSDYYILIIGSRYGTVIKKGPDAGISYTEKEFNYAQSLNIPTLVFIIDKDAPVKATDVEVKNVKKLNDFISKAKTVHNVVWWKTSDDLARKVSTALYNEIKNEKKSPRPGWIRGDLLELNQETELLQSLTKDNLRLDKELSYLKKCEASLQDKTESLESENRELSSRLEKKHKEIESLKTEYLNLSQKYDEFQKITYEKFKSQSLDQSNKIISSILIALKKQLQECISVTFCTAEFYAHIKNITQYVSILADNYSDRISVIHLTASFKDLTNAIKAVSKNKAYSCLHIMLNHVDLYLSAAT